MTMDVNQIFIWCSLIIIGSVVNAFPCFTHDQNNILKYKVQSREFQPYDYDEIVIKLNKLKASHPNIFKLETARQKYNLSLPSTIQCSDQFGECEHYIVIITEHNSWPNDKSRPHVFLSGAVHGNEKVGPNAMMELCEYLLSEHDANNEWIKHLIATRVIIITPMTNPVGYAKSTRDEPNYLDPNRDFPYMQTAENCMKTICGRMINEIFREYLIQIGITFHGGQRSISFEWGSPNHLKPNDASPDHMAQLQIAQTMQALGGHGPDADKPDHNRLFYPIGTHDGMVYSVRGGMEDWAYAGSWDTDNVRRCKPTTYGKYGEDKTIYNNVQLRAFNFLIEASKPKTPKKRWGAMRDEIGWNDIWQIDNFELDGHIPRNMRISMFVINSAMPYVFIEKYPKIMNLRGGNYKIDWFVSGAISVYDFDILISTNLDDAKNAGWKVLDIAKDANWRKTFRLDYSSLTDAEYKFTIHIQTELTAAMVMQIGKMCEDVPAVCPIFLSFRVKVDDQWKSNKDLSTGQIVKTYPEGMAPQSHVVNARNMDASEWNMMNNGYYVRASEWWQAEEPVRIDIHLDDLAFDNNEEIETKIEQEAEKEIDYDYNGLLSIQFMAFFMCGVMMIAAIVYRKKIRLQRRQNQGNYRRVPTSMV